MCDLDAHGGSYQVIRLSLLLALVACHEPVAEEVVTPPPPGFAIAFERILPMSAQHQPPQFGEGGAITIGATCWRKDGQRIEACVKRVLDTLITGREVSPARTATLEIDDDELVIHWTNEEARIKDVKRACWIDERHIAWITDGKLVTFDIAQRKTLDAGPLAGELVACDPAGGRVAIATETDLKIVDLATREPQGHLALHADHVAFAGDKLAVVTDHTLVMFRRFGRAYLPELRRTGAAIAQLAFSRDASRLAVVGETLVMFELGAPSPRIPELPVATLAEGFTSGITNEAWHYAQLARPSRWAPLPALLVDAQQEAALREVRALAIDPATVSARLAPDANDAAIHAYALHIMPELFDSWANAKLGTGNDAEFTLRTGRREGKAWFETRELWTDGCEPYDGYTQVVIDRDLLFVTRVLVAPHDTTNPWIQTFFDLPFQTRTQLARRRGPDPGPC